MFTLIFVSTFCHATGNGFDRGGGCLVRMPDGQLYPLDFDNQGIPPTQVPQAPGEILNPKSLWLHNNSPKVFAEALRRIDQWGKQSDKAHMISLWVSSALYGLSNLKDKPFDQVPWGCVSKHGRPLVTAAVFDNNGGIGVSLPIWNQLPFLYQVTLLVHEGFRSVQLEMKTGTTNSKLEEFVTSVVLGHKTAEQVLTNHSEELGPRLNHLLSRYDGLVVRQRELCHELQNKWSSRRPWFFVIPMFRGKVTRYHVEQPYKPLNELLINCDRFQKQVDYEWAKDLRDTFSAIDSMLKEIGAMKNEESSEDWKKADDLTISISNIAIQGFCDRELMPEYASRVKVNASDR